MSDQPRRHDRPGAWIVSTHDWSDQPYAIFTEELLARRYVAKHGGYMDVSYWPFGTEWSERWADGRDPEGDE